MWKKEATRVLFQSEILTSFMPPTPHDITVNNALGRISLVGVAVGNAAVYILYSSFFKKHNFGTSNVDIFYTSC